MKKNKNSKISNISSKNKVSNSKVTSKQTNKQTDVGFTTTNEDNSFKVTDCR